jgi:endonuclease/exonuclease/phosphatase family metal-dependent hydrolase
MPVCESRMRLSACILSLVCCVAPAGAADDPMPLRIVTFNAELLSAPGVTPGMLQKYRFDYARKKQLERVASLIEALQPDILNLVEVTSKEAVDQLVDILHEKGLTEYEGYHVDSHDTFSALDVALVTKVKPDLVDGQLIRTVYSEEGDPTWRQDFTFCDHTTGEMVTRSTSLARNSLYFITVGGHKLGFLGLHLKSDPQSDYANAARSAEAEIARRVVCCEVLARGYLPIVLGDLNDYDPDVPDADDSRDTSTTVLCSLKDFNRRQRGPELANVAQRIVRQADRYTSHWDWNENGAADGDDVYTMIDHVLMAKELIPYVTRVFICHTVSLDTSDHFPIVVDLRLPVEAETANDE